MKYSFQNFGKKKSLVTAVLLLGAVIYLAVHDKETEATDIRSSSVELGFSSLSPQGAQGGEILPASCESPYGYEHYSGECTAMPADACTTGATIFGDGGGAANSGGQYGVTRFGGAYCFGNASGPSYFVPTRTLSEFLSFYDAIPRLAGLFKIKACRYDDNCSGTPIACRYNAPDGAGFVTNMSAYPTSFGTWSNPSCGTGSTTGWHSTISSCGQPGGTTDTTCNWVLMRE